MARPRKRGQAIRDKHFLPKATIRLTAYGSLRQKILPAAILRAPNTTI
jgi:hypothetical protein